MSEGEQLQKGRQPEQGACDPSGASGTEGHEPVVSGSPTGRRPIATSVSFIA